MIEKMYGVEIFFEEATNNLIPEAYGKAYDESGMTESEFESFGASVHTMQTFLEGYDQFVTLIRSRMIKGN